MRFESFLLQLSSAFAMVAAEHVDREINAWLGRLAEFIKVDRSSLWEYDADGETVYRRHIFVMPGVEPGPLDLQTEHFPWLTEQYRSGNVVAWAKVPQDIPAIAVAERAYSTRVGAKSVLSIPMHAGTTKCVIAFATVRAYHAWPDALVQRLRLVGEIFATALVRQRAEKALQSSEARKRAILAALPDLMFVFSSDGTYLDYSCRDSSDLRLRPEQFLNRRCEDVLPRSLAKEFRAAIARAASTGERVRVEYPLEIRGETRDYEALIVRSEDGVLVCTVRNVTERKKRQMEIERLRLEIQHFGRVALMSQLTASLAHELLQPITAILADAEAGGRFIAHGVTPLEEVQPILEDIVHSSKRAAEIIHGVRDLLLKEPSDHRRVNLSELVQGVATVMHGDLRLRHVSLEMQLDGDLPDISGDAAQLQQVILNLSMNAAEAMSECLLEDRKLIISTLSQDGQVELTVSDCGPGAAPAHLQVMFDPFFTTKPGGLGLGLPICAEIVRQHRGRIWAENNAERGLTMHCSLPVR